VCGLSREQVIGRTALALGVYDDPGQFRNLRALLERKGQFSDFEANLRAPMGIRTIVLTGSIIDLHGEPWRGTNSPPMPVRTMQYPNVYSPWRR